MNRHCESCFDSKPGFSIPLPLMIFFQDGVAFSAGEILEGGDHPNFSASHNPREPYFVPTISASFFVFQ